MKFARLEIWVLIIILLVGGILRFWNIGYGLPHFYLADEEFFMTPALRVAQGSLDPGWFNTPAQPLIYLSALAYKLFGVSGSDAMYTAGRVVPVIAGTAMIFAAYLIGRTFSKRAGIIAAILVATNHVLVLHSHILRPDIMQTMFLLYATYGLLKMVEMMDIGNNSQIPEKNSAKLAKQSCVEIFTGIFWGLAIASKWPALLFAIPLLVFFVANRRKLDAFSGFVRTSFFALLAILVTGPFIFVHPLQSLKGIIFEAIPAHLGHDKLGYLGNIWWYFTKCLDWQVGTVIFITALLAIFIWREKKLFYLALTVLSYLLCISAIDLHWDRWMIPVAGIFLIIGAIALDKIFLLVKKWWIIAIIVVLAGTAPMMRLIRIMDGLSNDYTIETMRQWILANLPSGSKLMAESFTPDLPEEYTTVYGHTISLEKLPVYKEQGVEYAVITEAGFGIAEKESARTGDPVISKVYLEEKALIDQSTLLFTSASPTIIEQPDWDIISNWNLKYRLGPWLRIYRFL